MLFSEFLLRNFVDQHKKKPATDSLPHLRLESNPTHPELLGLRQIIAQSGSVSKMKMLLESGVPIYSTNEKQHDTAFYIALLYKHKAMVNYIVEQDDFDIEKECRLSGLDLPLLTHESLMLECTSFFIKLELHTQSKPQKFFNRTIMKNIKALNEVNIFLDGRPALQISQDKLLFFFLLSLALNPQQYQQNQALIHVHASHGYLYLQALYRVNTPGKFYSQYFRKKN